ncbi:E3 ubiquitin-protein ligase PUB22 [Acorus gramineus]|uniref:U-box domain-containing protein n=1 Tax=Acorus gramineus TaxID=55184 RepID=A0AAV9BDG3_ACOGR|nr:E3 ubiquitin-protein ligase PUB22 [Acorus gramineus]
MTDPVTVITGVTYDRHSIHRWISLYGHSTCPITNQRLSDPSLTPNSTLLRLIHSWTTQHLSGSKNRVRAVEAGTVAVLVELVAECGSGDRRLCEVMVAVLERVCSRAEGRRALGGHPMGIAAVAGNLMKVSQVVDDRATKVLLGLCRFCCWGEGGVVEEEMVVVGAVERLCLLVQVECGKARERAKEMLGLHWRTCTTTNLIISYELLAVKLICVAK